MRISSSLAALVMTSTLSAQALSSGFFEREGIGCARRDHSLFEILPAGAFDLDGSALTWTRSAGGFDVTPGGAMLPFGSGCDLTQGSSAPVDGIDIGFVFPFVSGASQFVAVDPAGYVYPRLAMSPSLATRCCDGSAALDDFLTGAPSFAVFGQVLNAGANGGGRVWFDSTTVGSEQVGYFTWDAVAQGSDPGAAVTCQIQFWDRPGAFDSCVMVWSGVGPTPRDVLVGWSLGGDQEGYGDVDLSAAPYVGLTGSRIDPPRFLFFNLTPPNLAEPFFQLVVNVPGINSSVLLVGTQSVMLDLELLGLPHCLLLTSADVASLPFTNPGPGMGSGIWSLSDIAPSTPSLAGLELTAQAVLLNPGANALGIELSDAIRFGLGWIPFRFELEPSVSVLSETTVSSGFPPTFPAWRVVHNDPSRPRITSFVVDLASGALPPAANQAFQVLSTAAPFAAGEFCTNTYEGTDASTGLVFAGTDAAACAGGGNTGWVASDPYLPFLFADHYRKLRFEFTDFDFGETFRFTAPTLGFFGLGSDVTGARVEITFADGTVVEGNMVTLDAGFERQDSGQQFL